MANHYPFVYQATVFWCEPDDDYKVHHYRIAGLGFCDSYTDAVAQIEAREGEYLESIEHLELIGERDETIIEISPTWVRPIIETPIEDYLEPINDDRAPIKEGEY